MTKTEFSRAFELAQSNAELGVPDPIFDGCGLPGYQPIATTLEAVAALLRWQCIGIFGDWIDQQALQEMRHICRHKFTIVGDSLSSLQKVRDPHAISIEML